MNRIALASGQAAQSMSSWSTRLGAHVQGGGHDDCLRNGGPVPSSEGKTVQLMVAINVLLVFYALPLFFVLRGPRRVLGAMLVVTLSWIGFGVHALAVRNLRP